MTLRRPKWLWLMWAVILFSAYRLSLAQHGGTVGSSTSTTAYTIEVVTVAPSGSCAAEPNKLKIILSTGVPWCCQSGTWVSCGPTTASISNDSITADMIHSSGQVNGDVLVWTTGDVMDWQPRQLSTSLSKTITISAPTSSEDVTMFRAPAAITITRLDAVRVGGSALTYTIRHNADRNATGTEIVTGGTSVASTTTGTSNTSLNSTAISAGEWVWLETTVATGTPASVSVTMQYTEP